MPTADRLAISGPADAAFLDQVHALLRRLWERHPVADRERFLFDTAVAEIAANLVEHAGDRVDASLELDAGPDGLVATFWDGGVAAPADIVEAAAHPDEMDVSGRGIATARDCLDELTYDRIDGRNRWVLVRRAGSL